MLNLSPGSTWDLLIKECAACNASPVTVTPEGDDDYLVECGDCQYKIRVESEDGEDGIVTDVLHTSTQCACGFVFADG